MSLFANDIKIDPDLMASLSSIRNNGVNSISSRYNKSRTQSNAESGIRGTGPNSYATDRYGVQEGLDTGALEAALSGGLGSTAYNNAKAEREYGQNLSLADQIAEANKPSLLDQIFSGIGVAGKAGGQYAALRNPKMKKTANYPMTADNYDVGYDDGGIYGV